MRIKERSLLLLLLLLKYRHLLFERNKFYKSCNRKRYYRLTSEHFLELQLGPTLQSIRLL